MPDRKPYIWASLRAVTRAGPLRDAAGCHLVIGSGGE